MQISGAFQFSQSFCVEWRRFYSVKGHKILLHLLEFNWAYSFTKRRAELRTRYTRRMTYRRAKQEDPRVIKPWFQAVYEATCKKSNRKLILQLKLSAI